MLRIAFLPRNLLIDHTLQNVPWRMRFRTAMALLEAFDMRLQLHSQYCHRRVRQGLSLFIDVGELLTMGGEGFDRDKSRESESPRRDAGTPGSSSPCTQSSHARLRRSSWVDRPKAMDTDMLVTSKVPPGGSQSYHGPPCGGLFVMANRMRLHSYGSAVAAACRHQASFAHMAYRSWIGGRAMGNLIPLPDPCAWHLAKVDALHRFYRPQFGRIGYLLVEQERICLS